MWSAHKCFIRGILIKHGHAAKQLRTKTLSNLLTQLYTLERQHKVWPDHTTEAELVKLREAIREHSLYKAKHVVLKACRSFYEYGDKCGRLLANALRAKRSQTYVPALLTSLGSKVHTSPDMAETFSNFYSKLYNLDSTSEPTSHTLTDVRTYLEETNLPTLTVEEREALSQPISAEEFASAITDTQSGKAPGPDGFTLLYYKTF